MSNGPYSDDVELVTAAQARDDDAFDRLYDRWCDEVYDVVVRIVRDREAASVVAQAVLVFAWQNLRALNEPASFGSWLLRTARDQALGHLEQDRRSVVGGEGTVSETDRARDHSDEGAGTEQSEPPDLVGIVSAALGERDTSILSLHLRHDVTGEDLADELGARLGATNASMFRLRTALGDAIQAWALWHGGHPTCAPLGSVLAPSGVSTFGRDAVRVIISHAKGCGPCASTRPEMISPEELFAAVPDVAAPIELKADVVAAVEAQGAQADATGTAGPTEGPGGMSGGVGAGSDAPAGAGAGSGATSAEGRLHRVVGTYTKLPHTTSWLVVAAALLLVAPALGAIMWIADVGDVNLARLTGTPEPPVSTTQPDAPAGESSPPREDTTATTTPSADMPGGRDDVTTDPTSSRPRNDAATPNSSTSTSTSTSTSISTSSTSTSSTSTSSTSSSTTSTSSTSSTQPPDQPEVVSFTAERRAEPDGTCDSPEERIVLSWDTENADEVSFEGSTYPLDGAFRVSDTTVVCSREAEEFVLTASGGDSSVSEMRQVDGV